MRKISWLPLLALLALPVATPAPAIAAGKGGGMVCPHFARNFARLADLPADARAAIGFPMAERGGRWNAGDAVGPGPLLPFSRFISAQGGGCTIRISYEYGGIAHGYATAILSRTPRGWTLTQRR